MQRVTSVSAPRKATGMVIIGRTAPEAVYESIFTAPYSILIKYIIKIERLGPFLHSNQWLLHHIAYYA